MNSSLVFFFCFIFVGACFAQLVPRTEVPDAIRQPAGFNQMRTIYAQGILEWTCKAYVDVLGQNSTHWGMAQEKSAKLYSVRSAVQGFFIGEIDRVENEDGYSIRFTEVKDNGDKATYTLSKVYGEIETNTLEEPYSAPAWALLGSSLSGGGLSIFTGVQWINRVSTNGEHPDGLECNVGDTISFDYNADYILYKAGPPQLFPHLEIPSDQSISNFYFASGVQRYICQDGEWSIYASQGSMYDGEEPLLRNSETGLGVGEGDLQATLSTVKGLNGERWETEYPTVSEALGKLDQSYDLEEVNSTALPWTIYKTKRISGVGPMSVPVTYTARVNTKQGFQPSQLCDSNSTETEGATEDSPFSAEYWYYKEQDAYPSPFFIENIATPSDSKLADPTSVVVRGTIEYSCQNLPTGGSGWVLVGPLGEFFNDDDERLGTVRFNDDGNVVFTASGDHKYILSRIDQLSFPQQYRGAIDLVTYSVEVMSSSSKLPKNINYMQQLETQGGLPPSDDPSCILSGVGPEFSSEFTARFFIFEQDDSSAKTLFATTILSILFTILSLIFIL